MQTLGPTLNTLYWSYIFFLTKSGICVAADYKSHDPLFQDCSVRVQELK